MIVPAAAAARAVADLAVGMGDPLERDRRDEHRQRDLAAEHGRRRRGVGDVDEHARAQLQAAVGRDVLGERQLVARAAREVAVRARLEQVGCHALVVPDVEQLHVLA